MNTRPLGRKFFIRNTKVVSRQIQEKTLVVPIRNAAGDPNSTYSFNALGAEIWSLLEKEATVDDVVAWVVDQYEVTPERAQQDVEEFLNHLSEAGLITPAEQASSPV
jgi:hypothetical protein